MLVASTWLLTGSLCSQIFKWYAGDFGPPDQLLPWLLQYLTKDTAASLQHLLSTAGPANIMLRYRDYDWSLNSAD